MNRSPSTAIECKTPNEVWSGKPSDYSVLRIFGCPAYYHVKGTKLEPRAKKSIFVGYVEGVKGYRLWCLDPESPKFVISRDVTFDENSMLDQKKVIDESTGSKEEEVGVKVEFQVETPQRASQDVPDQPEHASAQQQVTDSDSDDSEQFYTIATGRPRRQIRPPQRYGYADLVAYALTVAEDLGIQEPSTYKEAATCDKSERWHVAMTEEIESLHKNQT